MNSATPGSLRRILSILGASAVGLALAPEAAHACGCFAPPDPTVPLVQAGERILFSKNGDSVTAVIQIQYAGGSTTSPEFGWLLPLPSLPEPMQLGTQETFDQLIASTQPRYFLSTVIDPSCGDSFGGRAAGAPTAGGAGGSGSEGANDSGPLVFQDTVGPYDYAVLDAKDGVAMFKWLMDNRFAVPPGTEAAAGPYTRPGAYFLALKLRAGADTGDLQPVVVEYKSDRAIIPIILTSVAANPDMGVQVWMAGDSRAIPVNYRHTVINDALVDWQNQASNYIGLLIAATNEAPSGQSFVTEYAGQTTLPTVLEPTGRFGRIEDLSAITTASAFARYLAEHGYAQPAPAPSAGGGGGSSGNPGGGPIGPGGRPPRGGGFGNEVRAVLAKAVTFPNALQRMGVESREYYGRLDYYLNEYRQQNPEPFVGFEDRIDGAMAAMELDTRFVQPLKEVAAVLRARSYLTRLFTTLSPEEMTADPSFDFNPDLPEYSNEHRATVTLTCERPTGLAGFGGGDRPIRIARIYQLEDSGRRLFVGPDEEATVWPSLGNPPAGEVKLPASERLEVVPLVGPPKVEKDNKSAIDQAIQQRNERVKAQNPGFNWGNTVGPGMSSRDGGCATGGTSPAAGALLGLLLLLRRRRR